MYKKIYCYIIKLLVEVYIIFFKYLFKQKHLKFIFLNERQLLTARWYLRHKMASPDLIKVSNIVISRAEKALNYDTLSVVNKLDLPPNKNKNDYLSYSRYWWPNSSELDSKWVRLDGKVNPLSTSDNGDRGTLGVFCTSVYDLAIAYYFTGDKRFFVKGVTLLKDWFIRNETRMNPNLQFSQMIFNDPRPRRVGVIDGRLLSEFVLDAVAIFSRSIFWKQSDGDAIENWFSQYLIWLVQSEVGSSASKQQNNHYSWYCFQVASLSCFISDHHTFNKVIGELVNSLSKQINNDGSQSGELDRVFSFHYSNFNLLAITKAISLTSRMDFIFDKSTINIELDLIKQGIEFLFKFFVTNKDWSYSEETISIEKIIPVIFIANEFLDLSDLNAFNVIESNDLLSKIFYFGDVLDPEIT